MKAAAVEEAAVPMSNHLSGPGASLPGQIPALQVVQMGGVIGVLFCQEEAVVLEQCGGGGTWRTAGWARVPDSGGWLGQGRARGEVEL